MEERTTSLRQRIPNEKRQECLKLFEQGYGYKKTAQLAGLNTYTVREYKRRFAAGILLDGCNARPFCFFSGYLYFCNIHAKLRVDTKVDTKRR